MNINASPETIKDWTDALTTVLNNCDVHSDEAEQLEAILAALSVHVPQRCNYLGYCVNDSYRLMNGAPICETCEAQVFKMLARD